MFDHDHRVAGVDQPVQHADEFLHVVHRQAHGRLVEHVERMQGFVGAAGADQSFVHPHLGQLGDELDPLRFAAGQSWRRLAEREVAKADILHQRERARDRRMRAEELDCFVDLHREDVARSLSAHLDAERFAIEAPPAAHVAQHLHVGQEVHLDRAQALAFARGAAAFAGVEGKTCAAIAAHARFLCIGEEFADRVPETHVGSGAGARRLADRCLVDFEHAVDLFVTVDRVAGNPVGSWESGVGSRTSGVGRRASGVDGFSPDSRLPTPDCQPQIGQQHIPRQRRLAAAGHAGDDAQATDGKLGRRVAQVVHPRAAEHEARCVLRHLAVRRGRVRERGLQVLAGDRLGACHHVGDRSLRDHAAAATAGAGADVDDVLRAADGVLVVLDHHQRVALGLELAERVEQDAVVARMQADRGLVEHVAHALQVGAQLRREPDALRFAAGQRRRGAVEREITQAHFLEEIEP